MTDPSLNFAMNSQFRHKCLRRNDNPSPKLRRKYISLQIFATEMCFRRKSCDEKTCRRKVLRGTAMSSQILSQNNFFARKNLSSQFFATNSSQKSQTYDFRRFATNSSQFLRRNCSVAKSSSQNVHFLNVYPLRHLTLLSLVPSDFDVLLSLHLFPIVKTQTL